MSVSAAPRPSVITDRALESRQLDRNAPVSGRYLGGRAPSSKYFPPASKYFEAANHFFEIVERMWLTEIEDAAALLDLEDELYLAELEARPFRAA